MAKSKKRKSRGKKKTRQPKAAQSTLQNKQLPQISQQQPQKPESSKSQISLSRLFWNPVVKFSSFIILLITIISGLTAIIGPFWPTKPEIYPGEPNYTNAFNVPFEVINESILFPIRNIRFTCNLDNILTDSHIMIEENTSWSGSYSTIAPNSTNQHKCNFPINIGDQKIVVAEIRITTEYQIPFWPIDMKKIYGPYHWDASLSPPSWLEGELLP